MQGSGSEQAGCPLTQGKALLPQGLHLCAQPLQRVMSSSACQPRARPCGAASSCGRRQLLRKPLDLGCLAVGTTELLQGSQTVCFPILVVCHASKSQSGCKNEFAIVKELAEGKQLHEGPLHQTRCAYAVIY